jgi:hypothetical protein
MHRDELYSPACCVCGEERQTGGKTRLMCACIRNKGQTNTIIFMLCVMMSMCMAFEFGWRKACYRDSKRSNEK